MQATTVFDQHYFIVIANAKQLYINTYIFVVF